MKIVRETKDGKDVLEVKKGVFGNSMVLLNGTVFCDPCILFDELLDVFTKSRSKSPSWVRRRLQTKFALMGRDVYKVYMGGYK